MRLSKEGQSATFGDKTFSIGMPIKAVGSEAGLYEGLYGKISKIVDGEDKETDNPHPDIYCDFETPGNKEDRARLEQVYFKEYGERKRVEEIPLDCIIMAPAMLKKAEMRLFDVEITETLQQTVQIEAYFRSDAEQIAEDRYNDGVYVLDSDNFVDASFRASDHEYSPAIRELLEEYQENEDDMEV